MALPALPGTARLTGVFSLVVTVALYAMDSTWHSPPSGHGGPFSLQLQVSGCLLTLPY